VQIIDIMQAGPVIPVIVLDDAGRAVPLARALLAGGIRVIEITLRTPAALDAVKAVRSAVPEAIVGVGTITSVKSLQSAIDAGAQFGVSPGSEVHLLEAVKQSGLPFLPGTMTPSDVLNAHEMGFRAMKFFPASEAGGAGMLKALGSVFPEVKFCPTGGINMSTAREYLALPNVVCVGGSWLVRQALLDAGNWEAIEELARDATTLRSGLRK
jgi:2-dehydro-3-deoxyphosphogluconate aldolase/(4S)-4-hydroxy-2-oxoglutarate aldolase